MPISDVQHRTYIFIVWVKFRCRKYFRFVFTALSHPVKCYINWFWNGFLSIIFFLINWFGSFSITNYFKIRQSLWPTLGYIVCFTRALSCFQSNRQTYSQMDIASTSQNHSRAQNIEVFGEKNFDSWSKSQIFKLKRY